MVPDSTRLHWVASGLPPPPLQRKKKRCYHVDTAEGGFWHKLSNFWLFRINGYTGLVDISKGLTSWLSLQIIILCKVIFFCIGFFFCTVSRMWFFDFVAAVNLYASYNIWGLPTFLKFAFQEHVTNSVRPFKESCGSLSFSAPLYRPSPRYLLLPHFAILCCRFANDYENLWVLLESYLSSVFFF